MYRSLFLTPATSITFTHVESVVNQGLVETAVLDYKRDLNDSVVDTISAMANTDGGIILLGIEEQRGTKALKISGVAPDAADRLSNKCCAKLQPQYVPELVPVRIPDSEQIVLVIRVDPETAPPQTVVRDTGVLVRSGASNRHADLHQLIGLFSKQAQQSTAYQTASAVHPSGWLSVDRNRTDLLIRVALLPRGAAASAFLDGATKRAVLERMSMTTAHDWIMKVMEGTRLATTWRWGAPNMAQNMTIECSPGCTAITPLSGRFHASLRPAMVLFDLIVDQEALGGINKNLVIPMTFQSLFEALVTGMDTITDPALIDLLCDRFLLWSPRLEVHFVGRKPWLSFGEIEWTHKPPDRPIEESFYEMFEMDADRTRSIDRILRSCLVRMLLNHGALNADEVISSLRNPLLPA